MTKLKTLYHKDKHGNTRQWKVWTEGSTIFTEYGLVDGEKITSSKEATSKNEGRANARDPVAQAASEAQSLWTFKKERKYSETPEEAQEPLLLPMLAKPYKGKGTIKDAIINPKLDGLRLLSYKDADGKVVLLSRAGKRYNLPHIEEALQKDLPANYTFDGEIYLHGLSCQQITSYAKKLRPETAQLEYHIYDIPMVNGDDTLPYIDRLDAINKLKLTSLCLKKVDALPVSGHQDIVDAEQRFVEAGFEGAIVRLKDGKYQFGYRSSDLLKVKSFCDGEFEVVGFKEGIGKFAECIIFECKNDTNDLTFNVTPKVSQEEKAQMWKKREKYMGKMLTCRYFGKTDPPQFLPRFPVGIVFRDEKDLPTK